MKPVRFLLCLLVTAILLSGCGGMGKIVQIDQPETYTSGSPFKVTITADPFFFTFPSDGLPPADEVLVEMNSALTRTPEVILTMPMGWQLLGCTASGYPLSPDSGNSPPAALEPPQGIDIPPELVLPEGHGSFVFSLPAGEFWTTGDPPLPQIIAECEILPDSCENADLTYSIDLVEGGDSGTADPLEDEDLEEYIELWLQWFVDESLVVGRGIACHESVPTVTEWGVVLMSLFLAAAAVWGIRRRSRHG